jgi:L-aminopeptidase/D-esterase-like protein
MPSPVPFLPATGKRSSKRSNASSMRPATFTSTTNPPVPWSVANPLGVGHYTDAAAASGTTVVMCPDGAVGGVDVRGAAPGTRETDLLAPENLVDVIQAVCLSGGSVYGLAAADGVVRYLESKAMGFPLDDIHVAPIVPAAVLYDLGRGSEFRPPVDSSWGDLACRSAGPEPFNTGCVGAGTGAMSGGIKGGLGSASVVLETGIHVAALVAVNSLGSTIDPGQGHLLGRPS